MHNTVSGTATFASCDKVTLRAQVRARFAIWQRQTALSEIAGMDQKAVENLMFCLQQCTTHKNSSLGVYAALQQEDYREIDLLRYLPNPQQSAADTLLLPLLLAGRRMTYGLYQKDQLIAGAFGLLQPPQKAKSMPEVVVMPGLGFGPNGIRLGHGQGYYDRYIQEQKDRSQAPVCIGVCYDWQRINEIQANTWDNPCDFVVTDKGVWQTETTSTRWMPVSKGEKNE